MKAIMIVLVTGVFAVVGCATDPDVSAGDGSAGDETAQTSEDLTCNAPNATVFPGFFIKCTCGSTSVPCNATESYNSDWVYYGDDLCHTNSHRPGRWFGANWFQATGGWVDTFVCPNH